MHTKIVKSSDIRLPAVWRLYCQQFIGAFIAGAVVPFMGLYIVEGLGQSPWTMAVYSGVTLLIAMMCNRYLGQQIDRCALFRPRLFLTISFCLVNLVVLASHQNIWIICSLNALLFGVANASLSLMYSFGRIFAQQSGRDPQQFNARLRLCVSSGWMIGPGFSFSFYPTLGYQALFLILAALAAVWLYLSLQTIPRDFRASVQVVQKQAEILTAALKYKVIWINIPILCFGLANAFFLSSMALLFTQELKLPPETTGYELAIKCFVEIGMIYASVKLAKRWGNRYLLAIAGCLGMIFFISLSQASSQLEVLLLAVLDGTYYGIFAGVSLTYVQNHVPDRIGVVTGYYVNALFLSGFIGNIGTGVIATYTGFQAMVWLSIGCIFLSVLTLIWVEMVYRTRPQHVTS